VNLAHGRLSHDCIQGVDNPAIHGLFMDNGWPADKPAEVQADAVTDMGLTPADVAAISRGWQKTQAACQAKIIASGGFNWQLFNCQYKPNATHTCSGAPQTAPGRSQTDPWNGTNCAGNPRVCTGRSGLNCTAWLRNACQLTRATGPNGENELGLPLQKIALFFGFSRYEHGRNMDPTTHQLPYFMQDLCTFLLVRGPFAFLGYGWNGCQTVHPSHVRPDSWNGTYARPHEMDEDFGEPLEPLCREVAPGVFERKWSKANVQMNCNTFQGTLKMSDGRMLKTDDRR
jgi:hypothetical protein